MDNNNNNNIVFIYDDVEFSNENVNEKIKNIFSSIESFNKNIQNQKKFRNLYLKENYIKISNNYYDSILNYSIFPLSNIEQFNFKDYQSLILYFNKNSIENKMFENIKNKINANDEFCSIVIFDENRDDLSELKDYNQFLEDTLDYHFEIICDINNFNDFNEDDDGIATLNLSLHSFNWKYQNLNKKNNENYNENYNENKKENNNENNNENKKENKKIVKGKEYNKLNDEEEIEKLFNKIKEIKEINKSETITMEERRNNAEKAIYMLMDMFGLDENEENEENEENN